jgi:hypothetical protein
MRAFIGWLLALIPVGYIGVMLWHFAGVGGGSMEGIVGIGLGPTVLGLAIVGLLFLIGPLLKMIRVASGGNRVPGAGLDIGDDKPTEGFDADAAFASYMSRRESAPPADIDRDRPAPRPGGFGRKGV